MCSVRPLHVRLRWPCSEDEQPSNAGVPDRARISLGVLKFENPVVEISRSVRQRLSNIFVVQLRIFGGEFLTIRIRRQGLKHSPNRQSHSANTRLTVQDSGVARNSIEAHSVFWFKRKWTVQVAVCDDIAGYATANNSTRGLTQRFRRLSFFDEIAMLFALDTRSAGMNCPIHIASSCDCPG